MQLVCFRSVMNISLSLAFYVDQGSRKTKMDKAELQGESDSKARDKLSGSILRRLVTGSAQDTGSCLWLHI